MANKNIKYQVTTSFGEDGAENNKRLSTTDHSNESGWVDPIPNGVQTIVSADDVASALAGWNIPHNEYFYWGLSEWGDTTKFPEQREIKSNICANSTEFNKEENRNDYKITTLKGIIKPITITVANDTSLGGKATDHFTIYFDKGWGIYGTRMIITDMETGISSIHTNSSFNYLYKQDRKSSLYKIEITHQNIAVYPLIIVAILTGLTYDFNIGLFPHNSTLIEFEMKKNYDVTIPDEWQIIAQNGKVEVLDIDKQLWDLNNLNLLQNKQKLNVKISDANNEWHSINEYLGKFSYNTSQTGIVSVEMSDISDILSNINMSGIKLFSRIEYIYNPSANDYGLHYLFVNHLKPLIQNLNINVILSTKAEQIFKNIDFGYNAFVSGNSRSTSNTKQSTSYTELSGGTLFENLNKMLYIAQCYAYLKKENGKQNLYIDVSNSIISNQNIYRISAFNNKPLLNRTNAIDGVMWKEKKYYNYFVQGVSQYSNSVYLGLTISDSGALSIASNNGTVSGTTFMTMTKTGDQTVTDVVTYSGTTYTNSYYFITVSGAISISLIDPVMFNGEVPNLNFSYNISSYMSSVLGKMSGQTEISIEENYASINLDYAGISNAFLAKFVISNVLVSGKLNYRAKLFYKAVHTSPSAFNYTIASPSVKLTFPYFETTINKSYGSTSNVYNLQEIDFIQADMYYRDNNRNVMEVIAENMIKDERGLQVSEFEIPRINYYAYNRSGIEISNVFINGNNGEFLQLGQFVELWDSQNNRPYATYPNGDIMIFEIKQLIHTKDGGLGKIKYTAKEVPFNKL